MRKRRVRAAEDRGAHPDKKLKESVWRAARDYCERKLGPASEQGTKHRGLGLRFQAALAGK